MIKGGHLHRPMDHSRICPIGPPLLFPWKPGLPADHNKLVQPVSIIQVYCHSIRHLLHEWLTVSFHYIPLGRVAVFQYYVQLLRFALVNARILMIHDWSYFPELQYKLLWFVRPVYLRAPILRQLWTPQPHELLNDCQYGNDQKTVR